MASIIKRKSKYSVVYYYTDEKGEKHQKWETCQDYSEAKRRKAEIENQQGNGTFIPPQELTVKEFLRDFVKIYGTSHWALSTYESNCSLIHRTLLRSMWMSSMSGCRKRNLLQRKTENRRLNI